MELDTKEEASRSLVRDLEAEIKGRKARWGRGSGGGSEGEAVR